jgi:hypothetical protein
MSFSALVVSRKNERKANVFDLSIFVGCLPAFPLSDVRGGSHLASELGQGPKGERQKTSWVPSCL